MRNTIPALPGLRTVGRSAYAFRILRRSSSRADIDASVLRELKNRQRRENKTLGQLASELLARALADDKPAESLPPLKWPSQDLRPRVDLDDKDAVSRILDGR